MDTHRGLEATTAMNRSNSSVVVQNHRGGEHGKSETSLRRAEAEPDLPQTDVAVVPAGTATPVETFDIVNLDNTWKIWYYENIKHKDWEECLRLIGPFQTVQGFWTHFFRITSASQIREGGSYYVFKDGIKPMWEDPANMKGGRWLMCFNKDGREHNLDGLWLEVLLCLIAEAFEEDGVDVCGAVLDVRRGEDRIAVWTSDCKNKDRILSIGQTIKERLALHQGIMWYDSHESAAVKNEAHLYYL